jgi:2-polyprenyl-6-methoxyphenol hydroxylase-like FAD-dependent oxidoreductase
MTSGGTDLHVLIIGGGIGGLCLAQGLKKAGVAVSVYERDRTPSSRLQGFRIHIDPDGSRALNECLPTDLWEVFASTCGDFSQGFTILSEQLEELMKFRQHPATADPIERHRQVSRMTLRQLLLAGLGDAVHFDKRFERYERYPDGRVVAFFEDGSTAEGNVLVAADGVNSRVRKQYLPNNEPVDTGVISLGGKIPLTDGVMALIPPALLDGPAIVTPSEPANMFMAAWKRSAQAEEKARALGGPETGDSLEGEASYVVLALGAKRDYFGLNAMPDEDIDAMAPEEMQALLRAKVFNWHPNLRKLVEMMTTEIGFWRIRTSQPVAPWKPSNITLLGDAIHSMTPYRGIGANVALRDASLLCSKLVEAQSLGVPAAEKIGEYEAQMRSYGFEAVAASRKAMEEAITPKNFAFKLVMSIMRIATKVPALRRRIMEQRVTRPRKTLAQTA